ncbi:MAG: type III-B CRISPR-associated protein Cas10/Cmr2, partial [Thermocladium sp.]
MSSVSSRFFKAKAWALLHDPPNKMWIITGKGRCTEGWHLNTDAHEEESASIWYHLGLTDPFGDMNDKNDPAYKLVKEADVISALMDRWLLNNIEGDNKGIFKYNKLHNIFDPEHSIDLPDNIDCNKVKAYIEELRKITDDIYSKVKGFNNDEKARIIYHALYVLYELNWINNELPPSLADTRVPTHTVFDHDYAAAAVVNMLGPSGDIGGYLVDVDIPSIQRIVNSARKAGDFWAGSWLVSMLAWLTVWPLVWKYGPDIIVRPTLRLNPIYHITLLNKLRDNYNYSGSLANVIYNFYLKTIFEINQPSEGMDVNNLLIKEPIIPGSITLLLPRDDFKDVTEIEKEINENFKKVYDCISTWALSGKATDYCSHILTDDKDNSIDNPFLKISNHLYNDLKDSGIFNDLISIKINAVNLSDVYKCLLHYLDHD